MEVGPEPDKSRRRTPAGAAVSDAAAEADAFTPFETPAPVDPGEPRWSLWGDAEV